MSEQKDTKKNWFLERMEKVRWGAFIIERDSCQEDTYKVSIGRVMCWIVFGFLSYMWIWGLVIPETMITAFYVLVSYNVAKKISDPISEAVGKRVERREKKDEGGNS